MLPRRVEGLQQGHWVLMDYLDVVVHVFTPETRRSTGSSVWGEAPARSVEYAPWRSRNERAARWAALSLSGASRARTGDLVTASHALSQLSYSPMGCGQSIAWSASFLGELQTGRVPQGIVRVGR